MAMQHLERHDDWLYVGVSFDRHDLVVLAYVLDDLMRIMVVFIVDDDGLLAADCLMRR